jgi:hypothetical protein
MQQCAAALAVRYSWAGTINNMIFINLEAELAAAGTSAAMFQEAEQWLATLAAAAYHLLLLLQR